MSMPIVTTMRTTITLTITTSIPPNRTATRMSTIPWNTCIRTFRTRTTGTCTDDAPGVWPDQGLGDVPCAMNR